GAGGVGDGGQVVPGAAGAEVVVDQRLRPAAGLQVAAALVVQLAQGVEQLGLRFAQGLVAQAGAGGVGVVVVQPVEGQAAQGLLGALGQLPAQADAVPPGDQDVRRPARADADAAAARQQGGEQGRQRQRCPAKQERHGDL